MTIHLHQAATAISCRSLRSLCPKISATTKALSLLALTAIIVFSDESDAQSTSPEPQAQPYMQNSRVDYIAQVLQAFENASAQIVQNTESYINVIDRNNCQSALNTLRLECILNYAKENCDSFSRKENRLACSLYSDIIIVNKLSERKFIDKSERYRIAKNSEDGDVRKAMSLRIHQKYARIATRYALSDKSDCAAKDAQCLARGIDQFCLDYSNSKSLSWQYCTAALLWFMGSSNES